MHWGMLDVASVRTMSVAAGVVLVLSAHVFDVICWQNPSCVSWQ